MKQLNNVRFDWIALIALSIPLVIINVPYASELAMIILAFNGLYLFFKEKSFSTIHPDLKIYSILVWSFYVSIVISVIGSENSSEGWHKLGSNIHYLLAPFVAYAIYRKDLWSRFLVVIKTSVVIAAVLATYQYFILGMGRVEGGATSSTLFGIIVVIFAFISIIDIFKQNNKQRLISLFVFSCAVFATILSQTRIALVEFVILSIAMIFIWSALGDINKKTFLLVIGAYLFVFVALFSNNIVQNRVQIAVNETANFLDGRYSVDAVGIRLSMWESGLEAFKEKPFFGHGIQNTTIVSAKYAKDISAKDQWGRARQLHNDYINTLVGMGLFGFIVLLMLMLTPLLIFIRRVKTHKSYEKNAAGVILIVGYLSIAITDSMYTNAVMRTFFVFMLAITLIRDGSNK